MSNSLNLLSRRRFLLALTGGSLAAVATLPGCGGGGESSPTPVVPTAKVFGLNLSLYVQSEQDPTLGATVSEGQLTLLLTTVAPLHAVGPHFRNDKRAGARGPDRSRSPLFYFEAFDEPWKAAHNDYPSWGLRDSAGHLKSGMIAGFQS